MVLQGCSSSHPRTVTRKLWNSTLQEFPCRYRTDNIYQLKYTVKPPENLKMSILMAVRYFQRDGNSISTVP